MRQAIKAISTYVQTQSVPLSQAVVRLDGQYGNGAIVADLAGLAYVMRGKDYDLLDFPEVQARLAQPPDQQTTHPETGTCRALFDFPHLALSPAGPRTRVIVATRPVTDVPAKVGTTRGEHVYELFYTALPPGAFMPADVVALYLHRGAFETVLADEDKEQAPDRWCSHARLSSGVLAHPGEVGYGISDSNWGMCCTPQPCARRNLSLPKLMSLCRLYLIWSLSLLKRLPSSMGHTVGTPVVHAHDLPEPISLYSPMGHCAVLLDSPCMRKSADQNAMARYGSSMPHGSAIVEPVRCASSVKKKLQPSKRGGSVPSIGLSLHVPRP